MTHFLSILFFFNEFEFFSVPPDRVSTIMIIIFVFLVLMETHQRDGTTTKKITIFVSRPNFTKLLIVKKIDHSLFTTQTQSNMFYLFSFVTIFTSTFFSPDFTFQWQQGTTLDTSD